MLVFVLRADEYIHKYPCTNILRYLVAGGGRGGQPRRGEQRQPGDGQTLLP